MNLRDSLLPVVDLASRLGVAPGRDEASREVLVLDVEGFRFGVLIDEASQVNLDIDEEKKRAVDAAPDRFGGLVSGVLHSGGRLLLLLDPMSLLDIDADLLRRFRRGGEKETEKRVDRSKEWLSVVTFDLCGEIYALLLSDVREIIRYAEPFRVPEAPSWVKGVISVRGSVLPVVDPALRLHIACRGGQAAEIPEGAKIVVVEYGAKRAGILVDGIREVLEFAASDVQSPPSIACSSEGKSSLFGVVEFRGSLIGLLDKEALLGERELALSSDGGEVSATASERDEETFIAFVVEGKELGLPIASVREITRLGVVAPLPGAPDHVEGSMSLRGEILSVVNLRKRFGSGNEAPDEASRRLLVVESESRRIGYLVDSVSGVEEISRSRIGAPPFSSADFGEASRFVVGVAQLREGRILQIVDPSRL